MRRWLVLWTVLLCPLTAQAADQGLPKYSITPPIQTIPMGNDRIVPLKKGTAAPFSGQLYDPQTALRWANWLSQMRTRLVLDVQRERRACQAQTTHLDNLLQFEEERGATVEEDLRERLLAVEKRNAALADWIANPSWFRSTEFGLILGVVGSTIVAVAVGVAAN